MLSTANIFKETSSDAQHNGALVIALIDDESGIPFLGRTRGPLEYESLGADFVRIVPRSARQAASEFQRVVLQHAQHPNEARRPVVVFCEDGYNLSGYCIVGFLRQVFKLPLAAALRAFAEARPPGIFHVPYLEDLHALYGGGGPAAPPPPPAWVECR